jgi:hypothetical protein
MRFTTNSTGKPLSRVAQVIALSGVIAMSACQDVTGPEEVVSAANVPQLRTTQAAQDELKGLADNLDDITGWSLVALTDGDSKGRIVGLLNGLKGHLAAGKIAVCQQDVTDARAWFASLTEVQQTELGAIGVTLDVVQSGLDNASR